MQNQSPNPERDWAAYRKVRAWEDDWGGVDGAPEPTAGEIIRALAAVGYAGWKRPYLQIYGFSIRSSVNSSLRLSRPAEVTFADNGKSKSGHGSLNCANREKAAVLADRYARFHTYMTETRHNWTEVDRIHFADNSIEVVE